MSRLKKSPYSYKLADMTNHILTHGTKVLDELISKANRLKHFNSLLAMHLEMEIAKHCQVAKFEDNCLFVLTDNGSWATQLRFHIPDLMVKLRKHPELAGLGGIICKTRPAKVVEKSLKGKRVVSALSVGTAETILENAKMIKDSKLREIMERIAGNVKG